MGNDAIRDLVASPDSIHVDAWRNLSWEAKDRLLFVRGTAYFKSMPDLTPKDWGLRQNLWVIEPRTTGY